MSNWIQQLKFDPIPILVKSRNKALASFAKRDLLEESVKSIKTLWELPQMTKIDKQQENGLWKVTLLRTKDKDLIFWVSLATCRILWEEAYSKRNTG